MLNIMDFFLGTMSPKLGQLPGSLNAKARRIYNCTTSLLTCIAFYAFTLPFAKYVLDPPDNYVIYGEKKLCHRHIKVQLNHALRV